MNPLRLRRIMQLVLATAATDAAIACGGAIASDGESAENEFPARDGARKERKPSPDWPDPFRRDASHRDGNVHDAAVDAYKEASIDVNLPPLCRTGAAPWDPVFLCGPDASASCNQPWPDAGWSYDCEAVCDVYEKDWRWTNPGPASCDWTGTSISYRCGTCYALGRIPDGTAECAIGTSIGERLAMQAYYEAASVVAFERLAGVLEREGASADLVLRVRKAARDEERHARMFTALASERGGVVRALAMEEEKVDLATLALENAREGCVRETFGALIALHQAEHAKDGVLREAFASIAEDEITHAALSWELVHFFEARLGTRHHEERRGAALAFRSAATQSYDAIDEALGVPRPAVARAMFDDLFTRVHAVA
jgi:hypothetical protein